jgi:hypothetical protein
VTPRNNRNTRKIRTSPRKPVTRSTQTLSKNLEAGPAEAIDLDDVCSDLSSVHSTPRQQSRGLVSGRGRPSRSPNTSSKRESDVRRLERAALAEIPTRVLRDTDGDATRSRVLDTVMRDVAMRPTNRSAMPVFLDRQHRTPTDILLWTTCLYIVYSSHPYSPWYTPSTTPRAISH